MVVNDVFFAISFIPLPLFAADRIFTFFSLEDSLVWVSEVNRELLRCGAFCRVTPFFAAAAIPKVFGYQNYEGSLVLSSPSNFSWYFVGIMQRQGKAQWFGY